MLYRPVYLKGGQAPIVMVNQPPSEPQQVEEPPQQIQNPSNNNNHLEDDDDRTPTPELPPLDKPEEQEQQENLPLLISNGRFRHVIPPAKTRDVLTGKVAYLLVEDTGITRFAPKHILNALKLGHDQLTKYEDYELIGGHRRQLDSPTGGSSRGRSRGYKRRYVSLEYITKGIYGNYNDGDGKSANGKTTMIQSTVDDQGPAF